MKRLTHEADFGLEDWEETLFFVESDPNGAYNILDIAKEQGDPEFDKILKSIVLRLSAIENILGDDYDLDRLKQVKAERDELIRRNQLAYEIAWGCDIPSPTVPEYVELHKGMAKIMNALRGRKEETP